MSRLDILGLIYTNHISVSKLIRQFITNFITSKTDFFALLLSISNRHNNYQ